MSVVLRCPNCGTTQAAPGECEACTAAEVRYYCTNHPLGLWLDTPTCPQCGDAPGGVPRRRASVSPLRPTAVAARPAPRSDAPARPASRPASRPPRAKLEYEESDAEAATAGVEIPAGVAPWQRILELALRSRSPALHRSERPTIITRPGGCIRRFLLIGIVAMLGLAAAAFFFIRSLVHLLQPY